MSIAPAWLVAPGTDTPDAGLRANAIIRVALEAAGEAGLAVAALQASDDGRRLYERIGFREAVRSGLHEWQPAATR